MSDLAAALENLVVGIQTYKGEAPSTPIYPYVLLNAPLPLASERSLARSGQSVDARIRATVVAFDSVGVRWGSQKVVDALEGVRPVVTGWNVGRVENIPNDQPIQVDTDVNVPGYGNPMYHPLDFIAVASRTSP
ncbi:hypothetical protein [Arthrobacter roseus]|uniref:hypothetical protein n=1 Tax=Arthrobacter roseus TaxID=136274 RepID=UPI0019628192|nr:hypothetical protein [Arthrobacter roseus]MBM7847462.1 hypothetical protein [Arthrobacter roseus]